MSKFGLENFQVGVLKLFMYTSDPDMMSMQLGFINVSCEVLVQRPLKSVNLMYNAMCTKTQ